MARKWTSIILLGTVIPGAALYVGKARATPASLGFVGSTLAVGRLGEIPLSFTQLIQKDAPPWVSMQFAKGLSDLYVQNNVWQPKAHTGWHSHPGHSLIIVTSGSLTNYESSDPDCKPTVYTQGQAFVDHGGDDVHNIRNDTNGVSTSIAIQLIPAGAQRRVDVQQPTNCPVFPPF
jgi:quercetin dioxygenase-like cupin family protein